jgi:hypothetical protein
MKIPRMISIGRILIKESSTLLRSLGETAFKTAGFAVKLVAIFFIALNIKNLKNNIKHED